MFKIVFGLISFLFFASAAIASPSFDDCRSMLGGLVEENRRLVSHMDEIKGYQANPDSIPGVSSSFLTKAQLLSAYAKSYNTSLDILLEREKAYQSQCNQFFKKDTDAN